MVNNDGETVTGATLRTVIDDNYGDDINSNIMICFNL
jgi:cyanate lyase